jgi:ankyrin repeat protein
MRISLDEALYKGMESYVRELLNDKVLEQSDIKDHKKLLMYACRSKNPRIVEMLINHGCDPTAKSASAYDRIALVHEAAESGSAEILDMVIDAGADPKERSDELQSAMYRAGSVEVAKRLLELGVGFDHPSGRENELECALEDSRFEVAEWLLNSKGGVEGWGDSAALLCKFVGFDLKLEAVKLLLKHGADPSYRTGRGQTAIHQVCFQGDGVNARNDEEAGDVLKLMLDQGLDINAADEEGNTPLHEAVHGDWESVVCTRVLIERGADVNIKNRHGETPLMDAIFSGCVECVSLLLESGASTEGRDRWGRSAIEQAAEQVTIYSGIPEKEHSAEKILDLLSDAVKK